MFDVYRVTRLLDGKLASGDVIEAVAADAFARAYWVLTRFELLTVEGDVVIDRIPREGLAASLTERAGGVDLRVRDATGRKTLIAAFRGPNKLTRALVPNDSAE